MLQTLDRTGLKSGEQTAFKESISLFLALSVDGVFAVKKPVKELGSLVVGKVLCQFQDSSQTARTSRSLKNRMDILLIILAFSAYVCCKTLYKTFETITHSF